MNRARLAASLVVFAATLAGCLDANSPSAAPTPTRAAEPTPQVTTYELGTTVWYEGLVLHFDRAVATLDERGGPVEVAIRIENPGTDESELNAPILLRIEGTAIQPTRESLVPTIAAGQAIPVSMRYELQGIRSVDAAVVEVGVDPSHVARVPLTPGAGEPLLLEPRTLQLSGSGAVKDLRMTLRGGLLRWDLPDWSQELDAGLAALTLTYDVTYTGTFGGGFAFTGDNVALRLPDGKLIESRKDGHSQSVELIGPGKTKKGMFARFEIPAGATGSFALVVRNAGTAKAIVFTIRR